MPINTCFSDNLISSTKLDAKLVAGLNASVSGPVALNVDLQQVADSVSVNLTKSKTNASHARPSMFASISSFAENVRRALNAVTPGLPPTELDNLDDMAKQDFAEWQALTAAVALSHIYSGAGLKLSIQPVHLVYTNLLHRCILMEMDKDSYYRTAITKKDVVGNPLEGKLFYICQNDTPFAIFHPAVGLAAMKEYDAAIFQDILPWYKAGETDCHKAWKPIMNYEGNTMLDDFCLSRIAWWAENNDLRTYMDFIRNRQQNIAHVPAAQPGKPMANADIIDATWPGRGTRFATSLMFYTDPNGRSYAMPELFLKKMMLAAVGDQNKNKLIYNTSHGTRPMAFTNVVPTLAGYAPVAPFRRDFVSLLEHCTLEALNFDADIVDNGLREVMISVVIRTNSGEQFTIRKGYAAENLVRGQVPYMMIWPYLPLPEMPNGMEVWKNFYATWQNRNVGMSMLRGVDGTDLSTVDTLTFDFEDQGKTEYVLRTTTAPKDAWPVCTGSKPFDYALVKGNCDNAPMDLGMVFIPKYQTYNGTSISDAIVVNNNPVQLAVDFGTTSTVCALRHTMHQGNAIVNLPFRDYSLAVTCDDEIAKEIVDDHHWMGSLANRPRGEWNRKIFSVAQLFDRIVPAGEMDADNLDYYVDGRMFLVSGGAMTNYAGAVHGTSDPLREQKIMNDMKFAKKMDTLNYYAASVYLAGIYMNAVLYLLSEKIVPGMGDYIDLRVSFPNEVTRNALTTSWTSARGILNKIMDERMTTAIENLIARNQFYNEATATSAYFLSDSIPPQKNLAAFPGRVSVDIGGGTTDISITNIHHPNDIANLSLRYAGREVMVSSLIQYFRRFATGADKAEAAFRSLWNNPDKNLLNQFARLCGQDGAKPLPQSLQAMTTNSTIRMSVEMLLAEGMRLKPSNVDQQTPLLRQLIALKFFMMMRIVARTVKENINLWLDPKTGKLMTVGNMLDVCLVVSGTSAQMLQYIFDCDLNGLSALAGMVIDPQKKACLDLLNKMFNEELEGVLEAGQTANVRIITFSDVSEKIEVCHGMLQSNLNVVATAANAAAAAARAAALGQLVAVGAPNSAAQAAEREAKIAERTTSVQTYDMSNLKAYLDGDGKKWGLLQYITTYEQIFTNGLTMTYGLGANVDAISKLLDNFNNPMIYQTSCMNVAQKYAAYMVEDEQTEYIDLLTCMYLVEEIIDRQMAELQ